MLSHRTCAETALSFVSHPRCIDRIVPSKEHDIILNCSPGDPEQLCQVFICIMVDFAQVFNDPLSPFMGIHGPSPFLYAPPYVECNS